MAPAIVKRLLALNEVRVAVTTGRDEDLARRISGIAAELGKKVDVFGWTPEMPRLMAESHLLISKAGGATVQESLAAKTPMIITQIVPGQEEGNARLILERKAGALATTPAANRRYRASSFRGRRPPMDPMEASRLFAEPPVRCR